LRTTARPGTDDLWLRLLVVRCQTGDEAAFRELYGLFSGRTRRFAETLLDRDSAKDVQQEVWLTVYKRIAQLADPGALRTWLYMTTRHAAIDLLRRRKRESELLALHAQEPEAASVQDGEGSEFPDSEVIRSAVTRLPAAQREVVMLRYWEDLSYAEIAIVIGCSIGTVRSRLHYARRALEKFLTHQESIEGDIHECHS
jgi:RNA polymerase sigma-70 factor (ECF subfamily)